MWKRCSEIAKLEGVARITIQRWVKAGKYDKVKLTEGGHYRIWVDKEEVTLLYTRVSSSKQKSSLRRQERILRKEYHNEEIISDIASGFNFKRRGFKSILERAVNGVPIVLVATTQDRITRTGFSLIKWIIELSGGRIELLEEESSTEEFDTKTLIAFITSFINSHYGKRSAKRQKENSNK